MPSRRTATRGLASYWLSGLVSLALGWLSSVAFADQAAALGEHPMGASRRVYDLEQCLRLARTNYPKIAEDRAKLSRMEAQLFEAQTEPFSQFTTSAGVVLAPTLGGTSVFSRNSDVALSDNMALAWQVGVEGVIPLWTFGKITSVKDAARAQIQVGTHAVKKGQNEVSLAVRQAYYGLQLARDALALVRQAARKIDKYIGSLEPKVQAGDADEVDLMKLKMHRAELVARESEAVKQADIARSGLAFLVGAATAIDIPDEPLRPVAHRLAPVTQYLAAAKLYRPEVNMARAAVVAREAQLRMARARYYPDLGLGLSAKWSQAPEITDQVNPYVLDRANFLSYGVGLILKWKWDFLPQSARVAQASAQLEEVRATERYALGGVGVEVEKAFAEARDAERRLDAYDQAVKYARRWLVIVQQGIDVGTYDDEDIVDPAKEYALKRFARLTATFDYNMAMARLALATGWDRVTEGGQNAVAVDEATE